MPGPEEIKQSLKVTLFRIVLHSHDLRVVGGARTHVLVSRVVQEPLGVPNLCLGHARNSLKGQLDTPEAPGSKLGELLTWRRNIVVWAQRDGGRIGSGVGGLCAEAELVEEVHLGLVERDGSVGLWEGGGGFVLELRERKEGLREREFRGGYGGGDEW